MQTAHRRTSERLDRMGGRPRRPEYGEVHVWLASLRLSADALKELDGSLSPDERARADRFRNAQDREHFIAAHGIAREILASYAVMEPCDLQFETDRAGKPALDRASGGESLAFSMSHSGTAALYGVARERNVGVDIELIDPNLVDESVLKRLLSPPERAALDALHPTARADTLFRFWTLKEAYLKARGDGLSLPPSAIDVSGVPREGPKMHARGANAEDGFPWTLAAIPTLPGYAAAAACKGNGRRIVCRLFGGRAAKPAAMNGSA
jgi:4'-phosphopantetheinyl transferase